MTEQDIFNYVFFPEKVSDEIRASIEGRKELKPLIGYFSGIKEEIGSDVPRNLQEKIAAKIPGYHLSKIVEFNLYDIPLQKETNAIRYAADSEPEKSPEAKTFIDAEKKYILRLVTTGDRRLLYIFSTDNKLITDFTISVIPSKKEYHLKDNTRPLQLPLDIEIENIQLTM